MNNMTNPIIILGSARSTGKTRDAVDSIIDGREAHLVDLNSLDISPYDYEHKNKDDDYIPLMRKVIEHDIIVLATPVYWYSTSTIMKIFIDRVSDLLEIEKDMGRKLRGKRMFIVASYNVSLPIAFEAPIEQTCDYLGIKYLGCAYVCSDPKSELSKSNDAEISKAQKILFDNS
jgi:NAD(P)H-dependent FMN reductase